jgi:hypothetical protein
MKEDLVTVLNEIKTGGRVQFAPPIRLNYLQLAAAALSNTPIQYVLPQACDTLWLPPSYVTRDGVVVLNPQNAVIGIRINFEDAPILPWGLQGNNVSAFVGPVDRIFVTLLVLGGADIVLHAARGIGVGYSGGTTAAGTPSSAPSFGVSAVG